MMYFIEVKYNRLEYYVSFEVGDTVRDDVSRSR
jgi:hypothetical protein